MISSVRKFLIPLFLTLLVFLTGVILVDFYPSGSTSELNEKPQPIAEPHIQVDLPLPPIYIEQMAKVTYGQTLAMVLQKNGFSARDIHYATRALNHEYPTNRMPADVEFMFSFKEPKLDAQPELDSLALYTKDDKFIRVSRTLGGKFEIDVDERLVMRVPQVATGRIESSLYLAARNAGLPDRLIVPFIELFSWDLDFTRDIREGDTFSVVYEEVHDERGEFIRYGNVLAGKMVLKRKESPVSAFRANNGVYYDASGRAKRRALLRTPIEFTRISSHFNPNRKHPVLGYTRAHKGTDFAAPTGTPVKAAGDGRITEITWKGGYGRYIKVQHNSTFSTAYAHLSRYKRGLKPGAYVHQGDTIGYVGMSGTATGPHLHYEVFHRGRQVNAMRVKLPEGAPLPQKYKEDFKQHVALAQKLWTNANKLAQNQSE